MKQLQVRFGYAFFFFTILFSSSVQGQMDSTLKTLPYGAFEFSQTVDLPGNREIIFDALTGDISGWWDHKFSKNPTRFYIEPKPGGGFWELFDDQGNGVLHGTVIYVKRPEILRFKGPLGLSGHPVELVCTYNLEDFVSDSTRLFLTVRGSGELQPGWPETIQRVWYHFMVERFKPYILEGKHIKKD